MATTKPTKIQLVPLSVQARKAIVAAQKRLETTTRPESIRRRLMWMQITRARVEYQEGRYTRARETAEQAGM